MKIKQVDIFGVAFSVTEYSSVTKLVLQKAVSHISFSVFALPVHGVIEIRKDKEFRKATTSADIIVPDGQPVRWAMNFFYNAKLADRVYGPRLVTEILKEANREKLKVFLYGGRTDETLEKFSQYINMNYKDVDICGTHREVDITKTSLNAEKIRSSDANIVFVGLGCPLQEKWIAKNCEGSSAVMVGVGAAFSFHAGELKMAPAWMQKTGLEWLYRLVCEPKRMWKRYFYTNSYYIFLFICKILKMQK